VVCPNADAKLFITASVEVRAERRLKELLERDVDAIYACVLQNMKERDARDSGRVVSPLVPAQDALQLDTSTLDVDAVFAKALKFIDKQNCS
jgi:cytidylate kinase